MSSAGLSSRAQASDVTVNSTVSSCVSFRGKGWHSHSTLSPIAGLLCWQQAVSSALFAAILHVTYTSCSAALRMAYMDVVIVCTTQPNRHVETMGGICVAQALV